MPYHANPTVSLGIQELRNAHALRANGSFSRAAAALRISQPTLSRSIKALEERIGAPLFVRSRQGVEPTDFGHLFLERSFEVIARLSDLERDIALRAGGPFSDIGVCVGPYVASSIATTAMVNTMARLPTLRVRFVPGVWDTAVAQLRNRGCEFAVIEVSLLKGQREFKVTPFPSLRAYVVARAGHPLAFARKVKLEQALAYPMILAARLAPRLLQRFLDGQRPERASSANERQPFPVIEGPDVAFALDVVERTDALTLASLDMIRDRLEAGRMVPLLHEPWLRSNFGIVQLRERALSPAGAALVEEFRKAHAEKERACSELHARWYRREAGRRGSGKAAR